MRIALAVLFLILLGALAWGLRQEPVRISQITAFGIDSSVADYAKSEMQGLYLGLVPRDSTFFYPAGRIRTAILESNRSIAAVSLFRNGLTGLSIKIDYRVPVARWCGSPDMIRASTTASTANCFYFDSSGYVYEVAGSESTSSPQTVVPINPFLVYESLTDSIDLSRADAPLGSTLPRADKLPAAFDFARQLDAFGSPVVVVSVRGDEVDDILRSGTRITYVLGHEQDAFTALVSARENMTFADGSVEYVDLRFDGKVYLKKKE